MEQRRETEGLVGKGIYSMPEAARLIAVPTSRITRWLVGRLRIYANEQVFDRPLWHPELPQLDDQVNLSFRDLIELRLVDGFRRAGLSLPYIRKVIEAAQELVGDTRPFTSNAFKTDGRRLYHEVISKTAEPKLMEVLNGQQVFHAIIAVGLRDIEFEAGTVSLWRPKEGRQDVVLDPRRSFGQPIIATSGVPTAAIGLASRSGRSVGEIAYDFEIEERSVRSALAFEAKLAA